MVQLMIDNKFLFICSCIMGRVQDQTTERVSIICCCFESGANSLYGCKDVYLAVDNGRYVCVDIVCPLIAEWLNVSQGS